VNKESVVTQNQQDVSNNSLVVRYALNRDKIAWPDRGKHARSPRFEVKGAVAAKQFGRKTKFRLTRSFQHVWHGYQQTKNYAG
jgi:hypothetical protein